ncbi:MAG: hypothetical protein F6K09_26390 [Merismopedia sp. SIO2A8]|nr:hypothetical protein [Merismopedia sp. SIO2A8]
MVITDLQYADPVPNSELTVEELNLTGGFGFTLADALTQVLASPSGVSASAGASALAVGFTNVYANTLTFTTAYNGPLGSFGVAAAFSLSIGSNWSFT